MWRIGDGSVGKIQLDQSNLSYTFAATPIPSLSLNTGGPTNYVGVTVYATFTTPAVVNQAAINGFYVAMKYPELYVSVQGESTVLSSGSYSFFDGAMITSQNQKSVYISSPTVQLDRASGKCTISFDLNGDEVLSAAWAAIIELAVEGNNPNFVVSLVGSTSTTFVTPAHTAVAAAQGAVARQTSGLGIGSVVPAAIQGGLGVLGNFVSRSGSALSTGEVSTLDRAAKLAVELTPQSQTLAADSAPILATASEDGALVAEEFAVGAPAAEAGWYATLETIGTIASLLV